MTRLQVSSLSLLAAVSVSGLLACGDSGGVTAPDDAGLFDAASPPREASAPSDDAGPPDSAMSSAPDSSTSPSDAAPPDATAPSDAEANEGGFLDGGEPFDAGSDAADGGGDAAVAPMGQLLVAGNNLTWIGVTSDGFVIYGKLGTVYAVPTGGGPVETVFAAEPAQTMVAGPAVYTFAGGAGKATCDYGSPIEAWTAKHGVVTLASCSPPNAVVAASPDASQLAFVSNPWNPDAGTDGNEATELFVANLDGTGTPTSVPLPFGCSQEQCEVEAAFTPNGMFVWWAFDEVSILSAPAMSPVASFTYPGGEPFFYRSDIDPTGTWLWVPLTTGGAELVRMADGTVVATVADGTAQTMFDPENPYLDYITTSGGLAQLTLSDTPTETVITTSGGTFPAILALDPSGTSAVVTEGVSLEDGGSAVYAYLQPLVPNAVPTLLTTSAGNFYEFFTADGADLVTVDASGSVSAWPTAAPAPTPLLSGVHGSAVLTGSNFFALTSGLGSASPMTGLIVDATGKTAPWAFAPNFSGYAVVNDGAAIVYATTAFPWGIYVLSVP